MTTDLRRPRDAGSVVAFVPILVLLVLAGTAALVGIALQPSSSETAAAAPVIPNPELGPACTAVAGAVPTTDAGRAVWIHVLADCVEHRIDGTTYTATGAPGSKVPVSGLEGFRGVTVSTDFRGNRAVLVRWAGAVPPIVLERLGGYPRGTVVLVTQGGTDATATPAASAG